MEAAKILCLSFLSYLIALKSSSNSVWGLPSFENIGVLNQQGLVF